MRHKLPSPARRRASRTPRKHTKPHRQYRPSASRTTTILTRGGRSLCERATQTAAAHDASQKRIRRSREVMPKTSPPTPIITPQHDHSRHNASARPNTRPNKRPGSKTPKRTPDQLQNAPPHNHPSADRSNPRSATDTTGPPRHKQHTHRRKDAPAPQFNQTCRRYRTATHPEQQHESSKVPLQPRSSSPPRHCSTGKPNTNSSTTHLQRHRNRVHQSRSRPIKESRETSIRTTPAGCLPNTGQRAPHAENGRCRCDHRRRRPKKRP